MILFSLLCISSTRRITAPTQPFRLQSYAATAGIVVHIRNWFYIRVWTVTRSPGKNSRRTDLRKVSTAKETHMSASSESNIRSDTQVPSSGTWLLPLTAANIISSADTSRSGINVKVTWLPMGACVISG